MKVPVCDMPTLLKGLAMAVRITVLVIGLITLLGTVIPDMLIVIAIKKDHSYHSHKIEN